VANLAAKIIQLEKIKKVVLSIVFVNRQKITALNKKYLGRAYATDVLAFDFSDKNNKHKRSIHGDVVISVDQALKNRYVYKTLLSDEIALYIAHGILHLIGFDDHQEKEKLSMRREEEKIMTALNSRLRKSIISYDS
jgi:probable rRNA maturation factor